MARVKVHGGGVVEVLERLWLTVDGERIVAEGDPAAAALYAAVGQQISREEAERYGLVAKAKRGKRG
jgi:hypothetical protein